MNTARNSSAPKGGCMRSCSVCLCVSNSCPPQIENAADGNFRPMEVTAFTGCGKPCKRRTHSRPCPYVPPDSAFRDEIPRHCVYSDCRFRASTRNTTIQ